MEYVDSLRTRKSPAPSPSPKKMFSWIREDEEEGSSNSSKMYEENNMSSESSASNTPAPLKRPLVEDEKPVESQSNEKTVESEKRPRIEHPVHTFTQAHVAGTPFDYEMEGILSTKVVAFDELEYFALPQQDIANLPWRARVEIFKETKADSFERIKMMRVEIFVNEKNKSSLWNVEYVPTLTVFSQMEGVASMVESLPQPVQANCVENKYTMSPRKPWDQIIDPINGFFSEDRIHVQLHIKVVKISGVGRKPIYHFDRPHDFANDAIIVCAGDQKVYVSRYYLSMYSPFFHNLFFGGYREGQQEQVKMLDVDHEELVDLLRIIYPCRYTVNKDNVGSLLKLADRFEIQCVIDECSKFLENCEAIRLPKKLLWADTYRLPDLHSDCIDRFKDMRDIKKVLEAQEYKNLSDATKVTLLDKIRTLPTGL